MGVPVRCGAVDDGEARQAAWSCLTGDVPEKEAPAGR